MPAVPLLATVLIEQLVFALRPFPFQPLKSAESHGGEIGLIERGHFLFHFLLELDLIDSGAEEILEEEDGIYVYTRFADFGSMQKGLEAKGIEPISTEKQWIPLVTKELNDAYQEQILKLIAMLEEDDDVLAVYHNLS